MTTLKQSTFWTFTDKAIADISIYASNNLHNYNKFKDPIFLNFYQECIETIQSLKCYDV